LPGVIWGYISSPHIPPLRDDRLAFHFEKQVNIRVRLSVQLKEVRGCHFYPVDQYIQGSLLKDYGDIIVKGIPLGRFVTSGQ
jgi:hypothetical protein